LLGCALNVLLAQPITRVIVPACVHRDGKGMMTHFVAAMRTAPAIREYTSAARWSLLRKIQMVLCSIGRC